MTIEEYDAKRETRRTLDEIDKCIASFDKDNEFVKLMGIGVYHYYMMAGMVTDYINDAVLIDRFKQLLLERKQELLNEFD